MSNECLACGSKDVDHRMAIYFCVPGTIMVPNSYLLCEKHKNVRYDYDDIYDENGKRKEINHEQVIKRNESYS